jgi:alkylhydroperoxidase family enzyme
MIHLYHSVGTIVIRLWRALFGSHTTPAIPVGPRVLPAYAALGRYHQSSTDLDPRLGMLVTQLAAERSGCRWCIERGRHLWREAQLSIEALRALPRYETSSLFSNRERAALRFTDAVTRYSEANGGEGMSLEPLMRARQHLSEPEIAAVTAAVAAKHFFNPVTGTLGADAAPWGAPIGSSIRNFWL